MCRLSDVLFIDFSAILLRFGSFWWSKLEPCWVLDTIQEANESQIAKIAKNGTAPQRELNSEGLAGLKMRAEWTKNPSEMATNIDEKNCSHLDIDISLTFGRCWTVSATQVGPKLTPKAGNQGPETLLKKNIMTRDQRRRD